MMQYAIFPTDKDIEHRSHKYIERKMGKNGKWIYVYSKKAGIRARTGVYAKKNYEESQKRLQAAQEAYAKQHERRVQNQNDMNALRNSNEVPTNIPTQQKVDALRQRSINETRAALSNVERAFNENQRAKAAYEKSFAGRLDNLSQKSKETFKSTWLKIFDKKINTETVTKGNTVTTTKTYKSGKKKITIKNK